MPMASCGVDHARRGITLERRTFIDAQCRFAHRGAESSVNITCGGGAPQSVQNNGVGVASTDKVRTGERGRERQHQRTEKCESSYPRRAR